MRLMLVFLLLVASAAAGCVGKYSSLLHPKECAAWGEFFDATGGPTWTNLGKGCTKRDPCSCGHNPPGHGVCSHGHSPDDDDNPLLPVSVIVMYVSRRRRCRVPAAACTNFHLLALRAATW
jgi:hypothetical protein